MEEKSLSIETNDPNGSRASMIFGSLRTRGLLLLSLRTANFTLVPIWQLSLSHNRVTSQLVGNISHPRLITTNTKFYVGVQRG